MSENCRYVCELFVITPPKIPHFSPNQQPYDKSRQIEFSATPLHEITVKSPRNPACHPQKISGIPLPSYRKSQIPPYTKNPCNIIYHRDLSEYVKYLYLLRAWATSTAQATVHPTIGLLPILRNPIISTWAGTEDEPANCASLCIRPMVSVIP